MIISASRRTDIPAFYSDWFFNRLVEEEAYVRNPFNHNQIKRIPLDHASVDCFVFWTKDPAPMLPKLHFLADYPYYFQITVTSYGRDIECNVRKKDEIITAFHEISSIIGAQRVIWRYDPILLNFTYMKEYHYKWFEVIAKKLSGHTDKCIISFIDKYQQTERNAKLLNLQELQEADMLEIGGELARIAAKYGIPVESCAEKIDLSSVGIKHGSCIDPAIVSLITGKDFKNAKKDRIREDCGCIKSIDIGAYNTCLHGCAYCYANYNPALVTANFNAHRSDLAII